MGIMRIIAPMGGGKTVFTTSYAVAFSKKFPNSKIFSNYKLNLPNAVYSPYLFLPFSELKNCLIICDDVYALKNLSGFIGVIVNASRKKNITVLISGQYYTMIDPMVRILSDKVIVKLEKQIDGTTDLLVCIEKKLSEDKFKRIFQKVKNVFEKIKGIFDTNEIVEFSGDTRIKEEILKFSSNYYELESNIALFTRNMGKRTKLLKELSQIAGYENPFTKM